MCEYDSSMVNEYPFRSCHCHFHFCLFFQLSQFLNTGAWIILIWIKKRNIEDLLQEVILYEIYETSLRRASSISCEMTTTKARLINFI